MQDLEAGFIENRPVIVEFSAIYLFVVCTVAVYGDDAPCVLPFIYNGKTYYTCTEKDTGGFRQGPSYFWCATSYQYGEDYWKKCNGEPVTLLY